MDRHAISSYSELVRRSIDNIEWFWSAVDQDLGIHWSKPYERVLDLSGGIPWARWFVGGKINIATNCVERHAEETPHGVALVSETEGGVPRSVTYRQLSEETSRIANSLRRLRIRKGDAVGVFMPMIPEAVAAVFAIAKIGAIFVPIFSGFGSDAVSTRLVDSEAKALLTVDFTQRRGKLIDMKTVADAAVAKCQTIHHVLTLRRTNRQVEWNQERDVDWSGFVSNESPESPTEETDAEDPFMVIFTSGTTGRPKGAVHVHGGLLVKLAAEVAYQVDLQSDDLLYWVTDLGWIMAPWEIVGGLALGGKIFIYDGALDYPEPDRIWKIVQSYRVSILGIAPTLIRGLMRYGTDMVNKWDLSSLRILASSGEPWNPGPWLWYFENIGKRRCPIINLSGGTEVGACFLSPLPITPLKPCSLGGPALGMAVDIVDADGRPIRGGVGELVCRKAWPGMTRGLWKDSGRYIETYWSQWKDIWYHGDFASVDEDGFWYLHGRSDDTIKIAGKRVGPAEVESILVSHPWVSEAAAVGLPDEVKGDVIECFAVLKKGYEKSEKLADDLAAMVEASLGRPFRPKLIRFVNELPKTRNAKILRRAIRALILGKDPGDLSNLENPSALEEIARYLSTKPA